MLTLRGPRCTGFRIVPSTTYHRIFDLCPNIFICNFVPLHCVSLALIAAIGPRRSQCPIFYHHRHHTQLCISDLVGCIVSTSMSCQVMGVGVGGWGGGGVLCLTVHIYLFLQHCRSCGGVLIGSLFALSCEV